MKTIPIILVMELMNAMSPCVDVRRVDDCHKVIWTMEEKPRHVGWWLPVEGYSCDSMLIFKPNPDFCKDIKPECI